MPLNYTFNFKCPPKFCLRSDPFPDFFPDFFLDFFPDFFLDFFLDFFPDFFPDFLRKAAEPYLPR